MIESPATINVSDVIDDSRLGALQTRVLLLCVTCMVVDGFDVQAMGYAAPALIQDWHVPQAALGPVFGAGLAGVLVGSLLFSVAADAIGRRPVLVWSAASAAIITLLTGFASSLPQLLGLRFAAGIAMGGVLPNAVALAGEYSPRRIRMSVTILVGCGFTAGAAAGGVIASWLIPQFGWRAVFYAGGTIPLAVAVTLWRKLPESLPFLLRRSQDHTRFVRELQRVDPSVRVGDDIRYLVSEERATVVPIIGLFQQGRAATTLQLWAIDFLTLLNLYFLSNWLPTIVRTPGRAVSDAVLSGAVLQIGGTIGTLALSWLVYRFRFALVLGACFVLAAGSLTLLGRPALPLVLVFVLVFVAGFCVVGSQPALIALAASYYPTPLRSTGIGWVLGVGRVGAIAGPVLAGELLRLNWSANELFRAAALPAAASAVLMYSLRSVASEPGASCEEGA